MTDKTQSPQKKRQLVLGMLICILMILGATWYGIWALLHREAGVLIVISRPPGAEVILNRQPTNLLTPAFLSSLPADSFMVTLRHEGHRPVPFMQHVLIQPDETTRTVFFMSPITKYDTRELPEVITTDRDWDWRIVHIETETTNASVRIDGRLIHVRPPLTLLLEGGSHVIELLSPDGRAAKETVNLHPGQASQTVRLKLE